MSDRIKILIVEDNVIIADDLQITLEDMGYEVVDSVVDYEQAVEAINNNKVDLALVDIILATEKTGIDFGKYIRDNFNIPFIFITSNSDRATVEKAKAVKPDGYIVKPFEQEDLYTSIEITLSNFSPSDNANSEADSGQVMGDSIFVKKQNLFYRIHFSEIRYIKADNVYLEVNTEDKKFLVRSALKDYIEKLPSNKFFRAHKSYIINLDHIQAINSKDVIINGHTIPISKEFRDFILSSFNS